MKKLFLFSLLAFAYNAHSQITTIVKFKKLIHDFGNIKEESESVSCVFSFVNISDKPISIMKVETSCGCTTPEYSKNEIKPGDTGYVKAIYGTTGRPGNFNKNLFVYFNSLTDFQRLIIKGNVVASTRYSKKPNDYTTTYANVAFTQTIAQFPSILNTETKYAYIKLYNYNGYPIKFLRADNVPEYAEVIFNDSVLKVDDSMTITIKVDGSKVPVFGDKYTSVTLITDDAGSENKNIYIHTNLKKDYSKLSPEELKNAPVLSFNKKFPLKYGKKKAGAIIKEVLTITNTGKQDLIISKIIPSCSCVKFTIGKQTLKPGESIEIFITIDTVNQSIAYHNKYLSIFSNDPSKPEFGIKMEMDIVN